VNSNPTVGYITKLVGSDFPFFGSITEPLGKKKFMKVPISKQLVLVP